LNETNINSCEDQQSGRNRQTNQVKQPMTQLALLLWKRQLTFELSFEI
jgi:hypothetical protein